MMREIACSCAPCIRHYVFQPEKTAQCYHAPQPVGTLQVILVEVLAANRGWQGGFLHFLAPRPAALGF